MEHSLSNKSFGMPPWLTNLAIIALIGILIIGAIGFASNIPTNTAEEEGASAQTTQRIWKEVVEARIIGSEINLTFETDSEGILTLQCVPDPSGGANYFGMYTDESGRTEPILPNDNVTPGNKYHDPNPCNPATMAGWLKIFQTQMEKVIGNVKEVAQIVKQAGNTLAGLY